ncbi:hypothetical protein FB192DRAFT_1146558 [Mucor lusitanicus]|uniref:Secreted protein n=1 Tax=Mucor circinelloides f. lusitanicus TaxID=29924 RepID=A0A8H4F0H2_MUCCL|nr:hypothetical protein FB192DRAFT_1146558 [Mucor lusitanicus]
MLIFRLAILLLVRPLQSLMMMPCIYNNLHLSINPFFINWINFLQIIHCILCSSSSSRMCCNSSSSNSNSFIKPSLLRYRLHLPFHHHLIH